jgi:hypothetical protein
MTVWGMVMINLLEKVFKQVTDQQITALKVRTGMQRMDSTQIASNIVSASRLQLLVESLIRLERILSDADKEKLADKLVPFTRDSAGHYTYRIKGKQAVSKHLQHIGETIYEILRELRSDYKEEAAYQVMVRLFELDDCQTCPYAKDCPAKPGKRDPRRHLQLMSHNGAEGAKFTLQRVEICELAWKPLLGR